MLIFSYVSLIKIPCKEKPLLGKGILSHFVLPLTFIPTQRLSTIKGALKAADFVSCREKKKIVNQLIFPDKDVNLLETNINEPNPILLLLRVCLWTD